jgi:hypothetical protein
MTSPEDGDTRPDQAPPVAEPVRSVDWAAELAVFGLAEGGPLDWLGRMISIVEHHTRGMKS